MSTELNTEPVSVATQEEMLKLLLEKGLVEYSEDGTQYIIKTALPEQQHQLETQLQQQQKRTQNQEVSLQKLIEEKAKLEAQLELERKEKVQLASKSQTADVYKEQKEDMFKELQALRNKVDEEAKKQEEWKEQQKTEKERQRIKDEVVAVMYEQQFQESEIKTNIEMYVDMFMVLDDAVISKDNKAKDIITTLKDYLTEKPYLRKTSVSGNIHGNATAPTPTRKPIDQLSRKDLIRMNLELMAAQNKR